MPDRDSLTEDIAELCIAVGTDADEARRILAAQTDPLRGMALAAGAAAAMDFELKWRLFALLTEMLRSLDTEDVA